MNTLRLNQNLRPAIHTRSALVKAEAVQMAARKDWCEIVVPGRISGGFGQTSEAEKKFGPFRASFAQAVAQSSEDGPVAGVVVTGMWEIAIDSQLTVPKTARIARPHFAISWAKETAYSLGARVTPKVVQLGTQRLFECVDAGTSASTEPTWKHVEGATMVDGTAVWKLVGMVTFFEVVSAVQTMTHKASTVIRAREII